MIKNECPVCGGPLHFEMARPEGFTYPNYPTYIEWEVYCNGCEFSHVGLISMEDVMANDLNV